MRDLWLDVEGRWHVLCECGHILDGSRQHRAVDAWHAHRDEQEDPTR